MQTIKKLCSNWIARLLFGLFILVSGGLTIYACSEEDIQPEQELCPCNPGSCFPCVDDNGKVHNVKP